MLFARPSVDFLIVGLGNPGPQYEKTRHNAGFRALDVLAAQLSCRVDRGKFQSLYGQAGFQDKKLILLKPQTFMNLSGDAVFQAVRYWKLKPEQVIVLFDDISLSPGRLRIRGEGSAGGHNGIKSVIARLGSQEFPRVKIGVGSKPHPDYDLADWVLSTLSVQEERDLGGALERAAQAALCIAEHGVYEAANRFNGPPH